jgi:hypothetical protein
VGKEITDLKMDLNRNLFVYFTNDTNYLVIFSVCREFTIFDNLEFKQLLLDGHYNKLMFHHVDDQFCPLGERCYEILSDSFDFNKAVLAQMLAGYDCSDFHFVIPTLSRGVCAIIVVSFLLGNYALLWQMTYQAKFAPIEDCLGSIFTELTEPCIMHGALWLNVLALHIILIAYIVLGNSKTQVKLLAAGKSGPSHVYMEQNYRFMLYQMKFHQFFRQVYNLDNMMFELITFAKYHPGWAGGVPIRDVVEFLYVVCPDVLANIGLLENCATFIKLHIEGDKVYWEVVSGTMPGGGGYYKKSSVIDTKFV